jgi:curved DNA-binding protein CbpA
MEIKDYYKILGVPPSATVQEIKKSFRKLALQYHPDKSGNGPYDSTRFSVIKEAYEVLTNPQKKELYLQQRWYNQSAGKKKFRFDITPVNIYTHLLELEQQVHRLNQFRMDKAGLKDHILTLLSDETIDQLQTFNDATMSGQIIGVILKTAEPLKQYQKEEIGRQLKKLAVNNKSQLQEITRYLKAHQKKNQLEKYNILFVAGVTILICLIIILAG